MHVEALLIWRWVFVLLLVYARLGGFVYSMLTITSKSWLFRMLCPEYVVILPPSTASASPNSSRLRDVQPPPLPLQQLPITTALFLRHSHQTRGTAC
jgi:hypothetical protein